MKKPVNISCKYQFIIYVSVVFYFNLAFCEAQIHECNGTLTNKPCGELNSKTQAAVEKASAKDPEHSKKETLIHDLRMLSIKAKRDYDIRYDLTVTEENCKKFNLIECDKIVKAAQKDLQDLITQSQDVIASEQRNELIKESNKIRQERNEIEASKPSVVIQQNTILVPRRRPPYRPQIWGQTFKDSSSSGQSSSLPEGEVAPE